LPHSRWVAVGRLLRTRGRHGELFAAIDSTQPGRAEKIKRVLLRAPARESTLEVENFWRHDGRPVFKFAGIDSISEAEPWEGAEMLIPEDERVALEPGEFYQADLVGCTVETQSGILGTVTALDETGGPLLLRVAAADGTEILIPFARSICRDIDVAGKRIRVELPEGLLDL
jgi:16S rRNA processing protein RimM